MKRAPAIAGDALPDAGTIATGVISGTFSAREVVQVALDRIGALDGHLAAFCTLDPEGALAKAQAVDDMIASGLAPGPLAGVPVAIKDLIATKGLRTTFGSPLYSDFIPDEDDIVVARLRAAGAVIIGKTNASEFGYGPVGHNGLFPTTRNPWNRDLTPGGSSAGSAVAVAAGMLPLALGSDGGGSIRIPAALTGIFGMKPSWGRVPLWPSCRDERYPGASGWEALEHIGPLSRTVADAALALAALCGPTPFDRHSLPNEISDWSALDPSTIGSMRIAYAPDHGTAVDTEVAALCEAAALDMARAMGVRLHHAQPDTGPVAPVFEAIVAMETDRAGLLGLACARGHTFAAPLTGILDTEWSADDFTSAILGRKRIANATARFMAEYDLFLSPTVAAPAFPIERLGPCIIAGHAVADTDWTCFSALANLTGLPSASIPVGFTVGGLPVGLQVTGRHLADLDVLRAAALFEQVRPWAHIWPTAPVVLQHTQA